MAEVNTAERGESLRVRAARIAETPLSYALAGLSVAWLAWIELHGSSTDTETLVRFGALERSRVWAGEVWRLLSAAFVHVGWIHLAWNVAFGVPWCRPVERVLGSSRFLLVYLASAVGASSLSLLGQDVVSAGASGPLFGVVGATLALHRRALGSWAAFLRSRSARWVLGMLAAWSIAGALLLPLDQLAHAGGLAVGAASAWILSSPRPRRAVPLLALGALLAALAVAAAWPREGPTRFQAERDERAIHAALRAGDAGLARRLVERALSRGAPSDRLLYYQALLLAQEGDLEGALEVARPLVRSPEPPVREEARKIAVGIAKTLGYRHYTGDGARRDPLLGLAFIDEACELGDEESCANGRRIRGSSLTPPGP